MKLAKIKNHLQLQWCLIWELQYLPQIAPTNRESILLNEHKKMKGAAVNKKSSKT